MYKWIYNPNTVVPTVLNLPNQYTKLKIKSRILVMTWIILVLMANIKQLLMHHISVTIRNVKIQRDMHTHAHFWKKITNCQMQRTVWQDILHYIIIMTFHHLLTLYTFCQDPHKKISNQLVYNYQHSRWYQIQTIINQKIFHCHDWAVTRGSASHKLALSDWHWYCAETECITLEYLLPALKLPSANIWCYIWKLSFWTKVTTFLGQNGR